MRISDVKAYAVRIANRNQLLVKVETDDGIYGWGESGPIGRELAVEGVVKHYRKFLVGRDPMRRGALWQEMYLRESPTEHTGRYDPVVFPVQPEIRGDKVFPAEAPGLGVEVDEAALGAPFQFAEGPHRRREDGSYTNS